MQGNEPISIILTQAKNRMISATAEIMREFSIPAVMMEGVVSSVLADIRSQVAANLLTDFENELKSQIKQKEGEKLE